MNYLLLFLLISYGALSSLFAQQEESLKRLEAHYSDLDYENVVLLADSILIAFDDLEPDTYVKVNEIKAVSLFALNKKAEARSAFIAILKADINYQPDPLDISPKIIDFFEEVKKDYELIIASEDNGSKDSVLTETRYVEILVPDTITSPALSRSLLIPGWGHMYAGNSTKGWLMSTASAALIGGIIYYIFETNSRENDYLFESNKEKIAAAYDNYNSAYKIRNSLIISYALLWIYSQLDILLLSESDFATGFRSLHNSGSTIQQIPVFRVSYSF